MKINCKLQAKSLVTRQTNSFIDQVLVTNPVIFRTNPVLLKTNPVLFRTNPFTRYGKDMLTICHRYVPEMSQKGLKYVPDMSQICLRYVLDMSHMCLRYVPDMSQICLLPITIWDDLRIFKALGNSSVSPALQTNN